MNRLMARLMALLGLVAVCSFDLGHLARADQKTIVHGYCTGLKLADIPAGNFSDYPFPERKLACPPDKPKCKDAEKTLQSIFRITQKYHNTYEERWLDKKGVAHWGHDGIDIHERGLDEGVADIVAIQGGKVIASKTGVYGSGWGNRISIATRVPYSHEIITINYAHMFPGSLQFGKCDAVTQGAAIGKEGDTGFATSTHLHVTVRRWESIDDLNKALDQGDNAAGLFQKGYEKKDEAYFANYLDGHHLVTGKFEEFECQGATCPTWARKHALAARRAGVDFGRYDRYFAVNPRPSPKDPPIDLLRKGESARWFKVGRRFDTVDKQTATFTDISPKSPHFPYVETLVSQGVFAADADCDPGTPGQQFCPDQIRSRAELLKMAILSFMKPEYDQWQNDPAGLAKHDADVQSGQYFTDLYDPATGTWHWGTSYILFAAFNAQAQLVDVKSKFNPDGAIDKLQAVKVFMIARGFYLGKLKEDQYAACDDTYCPASQMCVSSDQDSGGVDVVEVQCVDLPICNAKADQPCTEYGGGVGPNNPLCGPDAVCGPGETKQQACGNAGSQTAVCQADCTWGAWSNCQSAPTCSDNVKNQGETGVDCGGPCPPCGSCGDGVCNGSETQATCCLDCGNCPVCSDGQTMSCGSCGTATCSNGKWGACANQGVCMPGQTMAQSCNGSGTQSSTCSNACQWGPYGACMGGCVCNQGACCDGCNYRDSGNSCNQWDVYQCQGPSPGQDAQKAVVQQYCSGVSASCDGATQQGSWQTAADCSASEVCQMSGGTASCVPAPCQDVYLASSLSACNNNPQGAGSPTLCLEVQQQSGASWQYRVCKQGGTFGNNFTYHLQDDNYSMVWNSLGGTAGSTCSGWQSVNVGYVSGYGPVNGAGLMVYLTSPSGCNQAGCQYNTAYVTIRKECQ